MFYNSQYEHIDYKIVSHLHIRIVFDRSDNVGVGKVLMRSLEPQGTQKRLQMNFLSEKCALFS